MDEKAVYYLCWGYLVIDKLIPVCPQVLSQIQSVSWHTCHWMWMLFWPFACMKWTLEYLPLLISCDRGLMPSSRFQMAVHKQPGDVPVGFGTASQINYHGCRLCGLVSVYLMRRGKWKRHRCCSICRTVGSCWCLWGFFGISYMFMHKRTQHMTIISWH